MTIVKMHALSKGCLRQQSPTRSALRTPAPASLSHTFTPKLGVQLRNADFAVLYDPARAWERAAADRWIRAMRPLAPSRKNYPYRGTSDGLTTSLRRLHPPDRYASCKEGKDGKKPPLHWWHSHWL